MSDAVGSIYEKFVTSGSPVETTPIKSGHINDTFLIKTDREESFVLQRINSHVFTHPEAVVKNKVLIADHIRSKPDVNPENSIRFVRTKEGEFFVKDETGDAWNLMDYIRDSHVFLKAPNSNIAFEAGRIFGDFLAKTADIDPSLVSETLPRFHSMSLRYEQFRKALEKGNSERLETASEFVNQALSLESEMKILEDLIEGGEIPIRVTHNDTKISNALFSNDDHALCVIDLDTVMPGIVHFDFGDSVRSICSGADEDEKNLDAIRFNSEHFEAFVKGFMQTAGAVLTEKEVEGLALSCKIMTFIVGLRFLTDYLNEDIYFDTAYPEHNLIRARNQFRLVELMGENLAEMDRLVSEAYQTGI